MSMEKGSWSCTHNAFFNSTLLGFSLSHSRIFAISRGQDFRIRIPHDIACSSTCWFLDLNYHRPSHSLQMPVRHQPACTMRPCQRKSQVKETSLWALCRLSLALLQLFQGFRCPVQSMSVVSSELWVGTLERRISWGLWLLNAVAMSLFLTDYAGTSS